MLKSFLSSTAPSAAVLSTFLLCAGARSAEPAPSPEARAHFKLGVGHLDHGRFADAYREFKEAYQITPRWTVLGNLGIAADHLERDGEAIDAFESYLKRGGTEIQKREVAEVRRDLERLRGVIATVTLHAPGRFWIVDTRLEAGDAVVNEYGPFSDRAELRVRAGQHEFNLDRASVAAPAWSVTLLAGDAADHAFEMPPEPAFVGTLPSELPDRPPPQTYVAPPSRTASYVLWGMGATAAIASTVLLLEGKSTQDEANDEFVQNCPYGATTSGPCGEPLDGDRKAAHWRTAALLTGIGAVGSLATGTVLYFLNSDASDEHERAQAAAIRPWVTPTGLGLAGTF